MKSNLIILFGGNSPEHEVSVRSAKTIFENIDRERFNPILIGVSRHNTFHRYHELDEITEVIYFEDNLVNFTKNKEKTLIFGKDINQQVDIAFNIIHGTYGEDGRMQGFLDILGILYVGCGVKASALCMDKELTKLICLNSEIPVVPSAVYMQPEAELSESRYIQIYEDLKQNIGNPFMIKSATSGSSRGVYKINNVDDLKSAFKEVFQYGRKILIEPFLKNVREIEVAVIGNSAKNKYSVTVLDYSSKEINTFAEIIVNKNEHEFYDYDAKYLSNTGAKAEVSVKNLSKEMIDEIAMYAKIAYTNLGCDGFARVDFFIDENQKIYLNEINTLPGFTSISMFPQMAISNLNIDMKKLLSILIDEALKN